ncbi:YrhB domain-containing protein [Actinophytocola oryzae]|uniref:Papain fold toxin 1 (Glutamine deamidase) of polymorphic toxin system n=1 Tax=Actinophytocola oryzae TaxID=502181 RepID=A0A4R7VZ38_9PSEU|nr:YrhB domain-containing protein [Actinophytocola oryzae]TDV55045.1 papain fold toxin 1 (glutamine deamidase) of polymorphic toxin system [Actinophytocola oryzae]
MTASLARDWLVRVHSGRAELADTAPVIETATATVFACRLAGRPDPMLTSAVAVPRNGSMPFHLATDDPLGDLAGHAAEPTPRPLRRQAARTNARGRVLAVDAAVDGYPASAVPWRPDDETAGWWDRLVGHFPGARVGECATWDEVVRAVAATGPDTRGVVWIRREVAGLEFTGHLVYAHNNDGQVVLLDGQTGGLARLDTGGVRGLRLARFHRQRPGVGVEPWRRSAPTFPAAVAKARAWLALRHAGQLVLIAPSPYDEMRRGWLFACSSARYVTYHDWRAQTLDGALVVPKDEAAPFGLPNAEPWNWLRDWDLGAVEAVPEPAAGGPPSWYAETMPRLGPVLSTSVHPNGESVLAELSRFPRDARALVWLRRRDRRGRESVGALFNALIGAAGPILVESSTGRTAVLDQPGLLALHVIRYH